MSGDDEKFANEPSNQTKEEKSVEKKGIVRGEITMTEKVKFEAGDPRRTTKPLGRG